MQKMTKSAMTGMVVILIVSFLGCSSSPFTTKVHDGNQFKVSKGIQVKDFSLKEVKINFKGNIDSLCHVMSVYIQKELQDQKSGLIIIGLSGDSTNTDMILEGTFTAIDEGDATGRVLLGAGGATVGVEGVIKGPDGKLLAEFSKSKTSAGGPIGMGGMLSGSGQEIINDIMKEIAEEVAEFIIEQTAKE